MRGKNNAVIKKEQGIFNPLFYGEEQMSFNKIDLAYVDTWNYAVPTAIIFRDFQYSKYNLK